MFITELGKYPAFSVSDNVNASPWPITLDSLQRILGPSPHAMYNKFAIFFPINFCSANLYYNLKLGNLAQADTFGIKSIILLGLLTLTFNSLSICY